MGITIVAALVLAMAAPTEVSSDDIYTAVRTNNLVQLKALTGVNAKDRRGSTPLMYAALVGSVDAMKLLLAAGADVNARNAVDATALMWSVQDIAKVRLLLDAGADVNARSKKGRTPLLIAAFNFGSIDVVRLLLAKGADPKATSEFGTTTLLAATAAEDNELLRLFLEKGVDVNTADKAGFTPLMNAASVQNLEAVRLLLAKGARVNAANIEGGTVLNGPIALRNLTPLMMAAPFASPELVATLLEAGAQINGQDGRAMTPLMLAVGSETQDPAVVRMLLAKGADVKIKSAVNETAVDWARKYGNPAVLQLMKGGQPTAAPRPLTGLDTVAQADLRQAAAKSVALLQSSSTEFFKKSACVGCHHQNLGALAVSTARHQGVAVDESAAAEHLKIVKLEWAGRRETLVQRMDAPGGADSVAYSLFGLAAAGYPPDAVTDAMVVNLAGLQNGHRKLGWLRAVALSD